MNSWPDGQWFDDSDETYDGTPAEDYITVDALSDTAVVTFTCGVVYANREFDEEGVSLVTHFRKWLKRLTLTTLVCEVPTTKLDEFATMLKGMGGNRVS